MRTTVVHRASVSGQCCGLNVAVKHANRPSMPVQTAYYREVCCRATAEDAPAVVSGSDLLGASKPVRGAAGGAASSLPPAERLAALELKSGRGVDYEPLRAALLEGDFLKADDIHRKKLIEVAGEAAVERGWVYFTEVKDIPVEDLQTIDNLWKAASGDKFGFSVQRQLWRACNKKWSRFFMSIDWLKGENLNYRAWPAEFMYTVKEAPKGHLPLTNALRGTQLFEAILTHPAFETNTTGKKSWE